MILQPVTFRSWESFDGTLYIERRHKRYHMFIWVGSELMEIGTAGTYGAAEYCLLKIHLNR